MIPITATLSIDDGEIEFRFVRASGPGGQNVNKVSTAAELRFDIAASRSLPAEVKLRLRRLGGRRVTGTGVLVIDAQRFRTQEANRKDALARFTALVLAATKKPKPRIATKPTRSSKERKLAGKKVRSAVKRQRGKVSATD